MCCCPFDNGGVITAPKAPLKLQPYRPQNRCLIQKIKAPQHDYETLSLREQQVLDYLSQAYTYAEIAEALKIRYHTVHTHIRYIYEKLHVRSRTQAVTIYLSGMEEKKPTPNT